MFSPSFSVFQFTFEELPFTKAIYIYYYSRYFCLFVCLFLCEHSLSYVAQTNKSFAFFLDSCRVKVPLLAIITEECYDGYSIMSEDTEYYKPGWLPLPDGVNTKNLSYAICPKPWRYKSTSELNGYPIWAVTTAYSGGGYVAELGYYPAKAAEVVEELALHHWIDRRTRAVSIEFTVYNAQVNLFSIVNRLVEFLPTGGTITFSTVQTLRLYRYLGDMSYVILVAELVIVLVVLQLMYSVAKRLYNQGKSFIHSFWNCVDLLQVCFASSSIVLYFIKMKNVTKTMQDLEENPLVFVSFHFTLLWSNIDNWMLSFAIFLTTLKLLNILRYNSHIKHLARTFKTIRKSMSSFMAEFILWFLPFVMLGHLAFGSHIRDFQSFISAFQAMTNALLGASYFHDLQDSDFLLGSLFFLCFSLFMELIVMNMFASIINTSVAVAEEDTHSESDPEVVAFLIKRFKDAFGLQILTPLFEKERRWYLDENIEHGSSHDPQENFKDLPQRMHRLHRYLTRALAIEEDEELLLEHFVRAALIDSPCAHPFVYNSIQSFLTSEFKSPYKS